LSEVSPVQDKAGIFGAIFALLGPHADATMKTRETPFVHSESPILAGRDKHGNPHLLIPIEPDGSVDPKLLSSYIGYERRQLIDPKGKLVTFVDMYCLVPDVDALFAPICLEISEALGGAGAHSGLNLIETTISQVIARWREILKALEATSISGNAITGVVGELLALRCLVESKKKNALTGWVGQDKTRHDFEFKDEAYEVKASTVQASKSCHINGLGQLEYAKGTNLRLLHFQIERAEGAMSVADLVSELGALVGGVDLVMAKLPFPNSIGQQVPDWMSTWTFKINSATSFIVDESFPRISTSTISKKALEHASSVGYTLNLEGLPTERSLDGSSWRLRTC
jgi:hypothetical protein